MKKIPQNLQIGVIGLGKFGLRFGQSLIQLDQKVVGIDMNPDNVMAARNILNHVYEADAMNKKVLEQIGVSDLNHVLVSVGDSIAASAMISMYLKELGVPSVWVKAINNDHGKLLKRVGADEIIIPEDLAANELAKKIAIPGFIEHLPFDKNVVLQEFTVKTWAGQTLMQLDLTNRFNAQVIAVKKHGEKHYRFIPKANDPVAENDVLVMIIRGDMLSGIKS